MKNIYEKITNWLSGLFKDEKGTASSKRFVGIICGITLCGVLIANPTHDATHVPSTHVIDAVALLAFGCLGLTSLDKFTAAKNKNNDGQ